MKVIRCQDNLWNAEINNDKIKTITKRISLKREQNSIKKRNNKEIKLRIKTLPSNIHYF